MSNLGNQHTNDPRQDQIFDNPLGGGGGGLMHPIVKKEIGLSLLSPLCFPPSLQIHSSISKYNASTISYLLFVVVAFFLLLHFNLFIALSLVTSR